MTNAARRPLEALPGGKLPAPGEQRKRDLARIHMAKAALGIDDDHYRDLVFAVTRVRSAAELDWGGRQRLLEHFRKLGWKPPHKGGSGDKQVALIRALWHQLAAAGAVEHDTDAALAAYVHRMTGRSAVQWLSTAEARRVIEALKQWRKRLQPAEEAA